MVGFSCFHAGRPAWGMIRDLVNFGRRWVVFFAETQNTQAKPQNADKTTASLAFLPVLRIKNRRKLARCGAAAPFAPKKRAALERSYFAVRRLPLIFAWK